MWTGPHTAGTAAHTYSLVRYATPLRICRNYAFWFSTLDETGFYAGAFLVVKHNSTDSKCLRYALTREYVCATVPAVCEPSLYQ